jgi:hypothetical protein
VELWFSLDGTSALATTGVCWVEMWEMWEMWGAGCQDSEGRRPKNANSQFCRIHFHSLSSRRLQLNSSTGLTTPLGQHIAASNTFISNTQPTCLLSRRSPGCVRLRSTHRTRTMIDPAHRSASAASLRSGVLLFTSMFDPGILGGPSIA